MLRTTGINCFDATSSCPPPPPPLAHALSPRGQFVMDICRHSRKLWRALARRAGAFDAVDGQRVVHGARAGQAGPGLRCRHLQWRPRCDDRRQRLAEQLQHAPDDVADRQFWRDKGPREGGQEGRRAGEGG